MLLPNEMINNALFSLSKLDEFFGRVLEGKAKIERPEITFHNLNNAFYDIKTAFAEILASIDDHYQPAYMLSICFNRYFDDYIQEYTGENRLEKYREIIGTIQKEWKASAIEFLNNYYTIPWNLKTAYRVSIGDESNKNNFLQHKDYVDKIFSLMDFDAKRTNTLVIGTDNMFSFDNVHENYEHNSIYSVQYTKESNYVLLGRENCERYIYGGIRGAKITNKAFDILIANIPVIESYNGRLIETTKDETYCIERVFSYAAPEGVVVFTLPYFRFYRDVASLVSRNLKNVKIFKLSKINANKVIVIGNKKPNNKELDEDVYSRLRNLPDTYSSLPDFIDIKEDRLFKMPDGFVEVKLFRGSVMVESEFDNMFNSTSSTKDFWKEQDVKLVSGENRRPLLPFNNGQIGIILTSGCLDGVVDEGDGYCHLIKGRIIKVTDNSTEINANETVQSELVSNRVEINAFLPDGTFKRLA